MNNLIEYIPETSIKLEHNIKNACRFCVNNTMNLTSITSNVNVPISSPTNSYEENGINDTINISELIHNCFGLEINPLEHLPQYVCDLCFKRFIETYEFRKQCIWALNYWENFYHIENVDKVEKFDMPLPFTAASYDIKPMLPLDNYSTSELNAIQTKDQILNTLENRNVDNGNKNNNNNNNNINVKCEEKTKSVNNIQVKYRKEKKLAAIMESKSSLAKVCPYCGVTRKSLTTHMLVHTNKISQFICDFCGKSFQKKSNLYRHTRIHINIRRYKCKLCTAAYVDATSLRVHMLNHTEERKYECNICNKKFKQSCGLKTHILTHTLEKKIKCDYCDLLFINKTNKNKHHQNHHLKEYKYQCEFCPEKFYSTSRVASHRLAHTKINPYKCELCESKFTRLSDFNFHKRQHKYNII